MVSSLVIPDVETVPSLLIALKLCLSCNKVFIIGSQQLYEEALNKYAYLCDEILISHIPGDYECDKIFPYNASLQCGETTNFEDMGTFVLETIIVNKTHPEKQYLDLLQKILNEGDQRIDRTKIGTKSLFGQRMEFDLRDGFPLLTTKRTWFEGIKKELLFFISGKTDTKILEAQGVSIWKSNTSNEFLRRSGLQWSEGDIGPSYSFQWRHAGAEYYGCHIDYTKKGVDQLQNVIDSIKNDPFGRRHVISAWDVANIKLMVLPPCHCFVQFYVGCGDNNIPTYLDCVLYQRSADMFLGVPFNIASYALLLMIGHITQLIPRRFIHDLGKLNAGSNCVTFGDTHIYLNHVNQVTEQITRNTISIPIS